MQAKDWKNKIEKLALDILWSHWIKMGAYVSGPMCEASCDPEALMIITALMGPKDLRLIEVMVQWLHHYESIINIERLKNALKTISDKSVLKKISGLLNETLNISIPLSSQTRWANVIGFLKEHTDLNYKPVLLKYKSEQESRKKIQSHTWIIENNKLLQLRYAFGATAKADILYFVGIYQTQPKKNSDQPATGAFIAKSIHCNPGTVHRALEELKKALFFKSEVIQEKIYELNIQAPLCIAKPKMDSFFVDWFLWIQVFVDVISIEEDILDHHESVVISRLNKRIQYLNHLKKEGPFADLGKLDLSGIGIKEIWTLYATALQNMADSLLTPPYLNWGFDELTQFIDISHKNIWATYAEVEEFQKLILIDQIFTKASHLFDNDPKVLQSMFFIRAHSAYRASVRLAGSGQIPESFALMRTVIENALYAFHIFKNPRLEKIWMNKEKSPEHKKEYKKNFKMVDIMKEYQKNDLNNGAQTQKLYNKTIRYGAHPNSDGIFSNLKVEDEGKDKIIYNYYINRNELALKNSIKNTARIGVCSLFIFQNIFSEKFKKAHLDEMVYSVSRGL